jgi:paraquat-inducible protein A
VELIGCHECDAVVPEPPIPNGGSAICSRCGATLLRRRDETVEINLALTLAAAILFIVANAYPFLSFEMRGQVTETTLASGASSLWEQGRYAVAALVFLTTILAPAAEIFLLIFVLGPLHFDRVVPGARIAMRAIAFFRPWSMMEVFLIGIFVALVKLADMADIIPGLALWAFALLIPLLAASAAHLDPEVIWRRLDRLGIRGQA